LSTTALTDSSPKPCIPFLDDINLEPIFLTLPSNVFFKSKINLFSSAVQFSTIRLFLSGAFEQASIAFSTRLPTKILKSISLIGSPFGTDTEVLKSIEFLADEET